MKYMKKYVLISMLAVGLFCLMLASCDKEEGIDEVKVVDSEMVDKLINGTEDVAYNRVSVHRYLYNEKKNRWERDEREISASPYLENHSEIVFLDGKTLTRFGIWGTYKEMHDLRVSWTLYCEKKRIDGKLYLCRPFEFDKGDNGFSIKYAAFGIGDFTGTVTELSASSMTIEKETVWTWGGTANEKIKFVSEYQGSRLTDASRYERVFNSEKEACQYVLDEVRKEYGDSVPNASYTIQLDSIQSFIDKDYWSKLKK